MIDGKTLIGWGFSPGKWFGEAIALAGSLERDGADVETIRAAIQTMEPPPVVEQEYRTNAIPFGLFLDAETDEERANLSAVVRDMDRLVRVPTVISAAVMPDACPAGIIPVGGVVATENAIHPGFHSADICCSMAMSILKRDDDVARILDAAEKVTHFGPGGRSRPGPKDPDLVSLVEGFDDNPFLKGLEKRATDHFMTQGDGNHFLFVGRLRSTGEAVIVTHHGSRGLGADLYKRGMAAAKRHTSIVAPRVPPEASWIDSETRQGEDYWDALQVIREWTRLNHRAIHRSLARRLGTSIIDWSWNEHNFVFRKSDGLFYHGKGATPNWVGYSGDDDGRTLIPLNMAEPIMIVEHVDNPESLGFAPHGAGRNMSRTAFMRENRPKKPEDIDVRFWCGKPDPSELPDAYKDAESVRRQIARYELGRVVDQIDPRGSIMAGDWEADAPWRTKRGTR